MQAARALGLALTALGAFLTPIPGPLRAILLAPLIPEKLAVKVRRIVKRVGILEKAAKKVEEAARKHKVLERFTLERIIASYITCWILGPTLTIIGLALIAKTAP